MATLHQLTRIPKAVEPHDLQDERPKELVGAGDGTRTRYLNLGKVALCQVSYSRPETPDSIAAGKQSAGQPFS